MNRVVKVDPEAVPAGLAQERFAVFSMGMGDAEQRRQVTKEGPGRSGEIVSDLFSAQGTGRFERKGR